MLGTRRLQALPSQMSASLHFDNEETCHTDKCTNARSIHQMTNKLFVVRQATVSEADEVAAIARRSRKHFLPYLPDLHTFEEDKTFFRDVVFVEDQVLVMEDQGKLVGFCAYRQGWLDHLYFLPSHVGRNLGADLLDRAKRAYPHLQLWVFQENLRAISFYQRHGFIRVKETDGAENEEMLPDAMFEWRK